MKSGPYSRLKKLGKFAGKKEFISIPMPPRVSGKFPLDVNKMNIDLLSASSHKMYGPKARLCLFIREGVKIEPILHGGGQESGLRSSTVNVPAIVGFAKACEICKKEMKKESPKD